MSEITIGELKRIELFGELKRKDLGAVAELFKREEYERGQEVFRQGQRGHKACFVRSGKLLARHIDPQGQEVCEELGPDSFFGETSLLLGEPHDVTVQVTEDAVLLSLEKEELARFLEAHPSVPRTLKMREDIAKKRRARRFKWQDPDEVVIRSLRKHNIILSQQLVAPVVGGLFGVVCCVYGAVYRERMPILALPVLVVGIFLVVGLSVLCWYLIRDYLNDSYIVTNKRVVHEERHPFGREARAEAPLHTIQDIQESRSGTLAHVYNLGDLIIETAGERMHVVFRQIPDPAGTREAIFEQIQRAQAWTKAEERAAIHDVMRERFNLPPLVKEPPPPLSPVEKKRRLQLTLPPWLKGGTRIVRYFFPPMRHEEGDTITWRKHWIALIAPLGLPTLLIVALTLVAVAAMRTTRGSPALILAGYGAVMVFLFPWWLWRFEDWRNDVYQVTATRIVDVEKRPFYGREERREANLGVIQDINLEIPGFLAKVLNYGSVTIETAGVGTFTFDYVRDPRGVQADIFRRVGAFREHQRQQEADRRRAELLDWFSVYDQIRGSTPPGPQPAPPSRPQET